MLEGDADISYTIHVRTFHLDYQLILLQKRVEYGVMYFVRTIGFSDLDFFLEKMKNISATLIKGARHFSACVACHI